MERPHRSLTVVMLATCLGLLVPYVARAQESATTLPEDPAVVAASVSGVITTPPPPVSVDVVVPPVVVSEPSFSSPEEENVTDAVNVQDPGPVMPADAAIADQLVVASVGELPDEGALAETSIGATRAVPANNGDCTAATPKAPTKNEMKIEGAGSVSCSTVQRSLNVVACLDYREAGDWEPLACKPKTVSQASSTSKKVSAFCVPGRFFYRVRVYGAATSRSGAQTSIPTKTTVSSGRIPCAR
ncbi:MAG: hypothetical protein M3273_00475 [Actinomycetota bacterium]|nr:hypothetical protein [Actinomycetota bacterium]